jgi:hypothetical protein
MQNMDFWRFTILAMVAVVVAWIMFTVYAAVEVDLPVSRNRPSYRADHEWSEARRDQQGGDANHSASLW